MQPIFRLSSRSTLVLALAVAVACTPNDQDRDGFDVAEDCDDNDPSSTVLADDADCDGILTALDCDDDDASSTSVAEDADCDGTLTVLDCDDSDPSSTSVAEDADCDGIPTALDCDDADPVSPALADDADCDGIPTALDCDDTDPASLAFADDADCDGVPTAEDCDDSTAALLAFGDPIPHGDLGHIVCVPAGTYTMGCLPGRDDIDHSCSSSAPPHEVTLTRPFFMMQAELTMAQYHAILPATTAPADGTEDLPKGSVSWDDALVLADALNDSLGLPTCAGGGPSTCGGWRLPTEAEWEYAARAGEQTPHAGGGDLDDVGWHDANSGGSTQVGCLKDPNAFGLCDMNGNVSEWTLDNYATYPTGPATDPLLTQGPHLIHRGGSKDRGAGSCRNASRDWDAPFVGRERIGFRLVLSTP